MIIKLSPQRRNDTLGISRSGDILTINGVEYDFSPLEDGDMLPQEAVNNEFVISDVERVGGVITLTLLLPHGANASEAARFPQPVVDPPNGNVELPS